LLFTFDSTHDSTGFQPDGTNERILISVRLIFCDYDEWIRSLSGRYYCLPASKSNRRASARKTIQQNHEKQQVVVL
tara:strand:- start:271 stop:498 length:228 start_codon:yes stop_codon:yes gene_type:complete